MKTDQRLPSPWVIYKCVTANGESIITQGKPNPSRNPKVPHGQEVHWINAKKYLTSDFKEMTLNGIFS